MAIQAFKDYTDTNHDQLIWKFINEHRTALAACLDGMTEQEVRMQLVPSKTTLLGLVKHAIFVERAWFEEAPTGFSRQELGLETGPDESFELTDDDTILSVRQKYRQTLGVSAAAVEGKTGKDIFMGNRRGPMSLAWIQLHLLRELAQHCGHAEILREQIIAARNN
ncbi:DinB family protein [Glutamicibacter sp.]|uniref:DinB family protein n=1 Tax=Glutamicibacter sp. TaxID=1931995 RepID=UPI0028BD5F76|nr:DinB family protein [Glutamicibacter sp.]